MWEFCFFEEDEIIYLMKEMGIIPHFIEQTKIVFTIFGLNKLYLLFFRHDGLKKDLINILLNENNCCDPCAL